MKAPASATRRGELRLFALDNVHSKERTLERLEKSLQQTPGAQWSGNKVSIDDFGPNIKAAGPRPPTASDTGDRPPTAWDTEGGDRPPTASDTEDGSDLTGVPSDYSSRSRVDDLRMGESATPNGRWMARRRKTSSLQEQTRLKKNFHNNNIY